MSRTVFLTMLGAGLAVIAAGCIFSPKTEDVVVDNGEYSKSLGHPDSLINDLQVAYRRREIGPYAKLLGNEFIFHFLPADAEEIPDGKWNKDQDSTGTFNLFNDVDVTRITISLQWYAPKADTLLGEPVQLVEVSFTDLKVDIDGGNTTLQVNGDRQLFAFQKGDQPGEDPDRWYFVDWEDQGSLGSGKPGPVNLLSLRDRIRQGGVVPVTVSELNAFLGMAPGLKP